MSEFSGLNKSGHDFVEKENYEHDGLKVQVLKCTECGSESIGWQAMPDETRTVEMNKD